MSYPNPHAELERKRPIFFTLGILCSACAVLVAFEWRSPISQDILLEDLAMEFPVVETDIGQIFIKQEPEQKIEQQASSARTSTSTRIIASDREPIRSMAKAPVAVRKVKTQVASITGNLTLPSSLDNAVKNVHELTAQEMPYFIDCRSIQDAEDRFTCTQNYLRQHLLGSIKMPSEQEVPELPGKIQIVFVIDEYGQVSKVEFNKEMHPSLESAIRKSFAKLPPMVPGGSERQKVRVRFIQPLDLIRR